MYFMVTDGTIHFKRDDYCSRKNYILHITVRYKYISILLIFKLPCLWGLWFFLLVVVRLSPRGSKIQSHFNIIYTLLFFFWACTYVIYVFFTLLCLFYESTKWREKYDGVEKQEKLVTIYFILYKSSTSKTSRFLLFIVFSVFLLFTLNRSEIVAMPFNLTKFSSLINLKSTRFCIN